MSLRVVLLAAAALVCVAGASAQIATSGDAAGYTASSSEHSLGPVGVPTPMAPDGAVPIDPVPAVPEVPVADVPEVAGPGLAVPDVGIPQVDVPVVIEVPLGVGVTLDGPLAVDVASEPATGTKATDRSLRGRIEDPGTPELAVAGAAGAAAVVVAVHAMGAAGVKAFLARPFAGLARLGRIALRGLPFLVPLFSRIEGPKVLDNHVRARVHDMVQQEPGLSLEQVRERSGIAWGTAVHHLRKLEEHGMVVSLRQGNHRLFFSANTAASKGRRQIAALTDPTARRVASLVSRRPGIAQHELCTKLSLRNPAASKQLGRLEQAGLVTAVRDGRRRLYHATPVLRESLGMMAPTPPSVVVKAMEPAVAADGLALGHVNGPSRSSPVAAAVA